jgi:hypothetical protein
MGQALTHEFLAQIIEDAPVRALARLALPSATVRHEACLEVAAHLLDRLERQDGVQLALPFA